MMDLNILWFLLVGVLLAGYAMLDGFDLGVGVMHLFTKSDRERRISLNSIGPVWDGNEVWLVTGGGALFAAFPEVYATAFSGFYIAFMLLLFSLIFRAVAIEFRSKMPMAWWRRLWDYSFFASSLLSSFLIGVAMGNIAWGIELNSSYIYVGGFFDLLNPYSLMLGVTTVALFMMHGSIYLCMKTEGEMQNHVKARVVPCIIFFIVTYAIFTLATLLYVEHITEAFRQKPAFFVLVIAAILAIANIPREINRDRLGLAFLSSCFVMLFLMALFALGMFPNLIYSNPGPENSLNIYNGASSQATLRNMAIIAAIGVPIVISYTICIYWIFRGKVKLNEMSY